MNTPAQLDLTTVQTPGTGPSTHVSAGGGPSLRSNHSWSPTQLATPGNGREDKSLCKAAESPAKQCSRIDWKEEQGCCCWRVHEWTVQPRGPDHC